jgi:hypothetical protein
VNLRLNCGSMHELPDNFAETLARVLEPHHHEAAAAIIESATRLDDEGLRRFLEMFAARIRNSAALVSQEELRRFLTLAARGGGAGAP